MSLSMSDNAVMTAFYGLDESPLSEDIHHYNTVFYNLCTCLC